MMEFLKLVAYEGDLVGTIFFTVIFGNTKG